MRPEHDLFALAWLILLVVALRWKTKRKKIEE